MQPRERRQQRPSFVIHCVVAAPHDYAAGGIAVARHHGVLDVAREAFEDPEMWFGGRVLRRQAEHQMKDGLVNVGCRGHGPVVQPEGTGAQPAFLGRFAKVFGSAGALRIATSGNRELFALRGERNPYKEANLGVLQRGAWADMLLVNGDPTQNIDVLNDPERGLAVIIKNGVVHKNTLGGGSVAPQAQ